MSLIAGVSVPLRSNRFPVIELEPVLPADGDFVRQLAIYWLELGIAPSPEWAALYIERCRAEQGGSRHTFWATVDGRRVGFGMVHLAADWLVRGRVIGSICEFYIFPAERRHGVGTALARLLIEFLRGRGATAVELDVLPDNRSGMDFWGSVGFGLSHHHLRLPG